MARAWREHGKGTARAWQEHGKEHGKSMAGAWQGHGKSTTRAWQEHGKQEHNHITATARQLQGQELQENNTTSLRNIHEIYLKFVPTFHPSTLKFLEVSFETVLHHSKIPLTMENHHNHGKPPNFWYDHVRNLLASVRRTASL